MVELEENHSGTKGKEKSLKMKNYKIGPRRNNFIQLIVPTGDNTNPKNHNHRVEVGEN